MKLRGGADMQDESFITPYPTLHKHIRGAGLLCDVPRLSS